MRAHFTADVKAEVIRKKTEGISAAELSKEHNVSKRQFTFDFEEMKMWWEVLL